MNISVSRDKLYKSLQKIINVIPSKTTIDILYNVLLKTEDNNLKLIVNGFGNYTNFMVFV